MDALRTILKAVRKADQMFSLFSHGDKVLVGISGGKDSMSLLYCLKRYQDFTRHEFDLIPAVIDLGFPGFASDVMREFAASLGYELHVIDAKDVYQILLTHQRNFHEPLLPCSICARMKKASINRVARELGCNKVAFAHHMDDAIETLAMNALFGGKIATFAPKMYLERAQITFIRPFVLVRENDIKSLVRQEKIPFVRSLCPNDKKTMRETVKEGLKKITDIFPRARKNLARLLINYEHIDLWDKEVYWKVDDSDLSLKPVVTSDDAYREYAMRIAVLKGVKSAKSGETAESEGIPRHFLVYLKDEAIGTICVLRKENNDFNVILFALREDMRNKGYEALIVRFLENKIHRLYRKMTLSFPRGALKAGEFRKLGYLPVADPDKPKGRPISWRREFE